MSTLCWTVAPGRARSTVEAGSAPHGGDIAHRGAGHRWPSSAGPAWPTPHDVARAAADGRRGPAGLGGHQLRGTRGGAAPGRRPHPGPRGRDPALGDPGDRRDRRAWPSSRSAWPRRSATRRPRSRRRPLGEILPSNQPRLSLLRRVPVGVVGVISPFNVPLILSTRSVAPALALGNAVVLKPDLRTPIAGGFIQARVLRGGRAARRPAARAARRRRGRRRR